MTTETPPMPGDVAEPGFLGSGSAVVDMPEQEYHRHPALSHSGCKLLLPPSCPALFRWRRDNPEYKDEFDFGHAAHSTVLGIGQPIRYIDATTRNTKAWKEGEDAARAAGEIPLLEKQRGVIEGMAAALRAHPLASALLRPGSGTPEASLFWDDPETGQALRARLDWLPQATNGRMIIPDYKTTVNANPEKFSRAAIDFGYIMQDPMYKAAVETNGLADEPAFVFILQEKTAPYLVSVVQLDDDAVRIGRQKIRQAIGIYQACMETDTWPAYTQDVAPISLPAWYLRQNESMEIA